MEPVILWERMKKSAQKFWVWSFFLLCFLSPSTNSTAISDAIEGTRTFPFALKTATLSGSNLTIFQTLIKQDLPKRVESALKTLSEYNRDNSNGDHVDDIFADDGKTSPVYHSSQPKFETKKFEIKQEIKQEFKSEIESPPTCTQNIIDDEEFPFEEDDDFGQEEIFDHKPSAVFKEIEQPIENSDGYITTAVRFIGDVCIRILSLSNPIYINFFSGDQRRN